ncbi:hypothetical protein BH11PLA1_BH11PLA1_03500 [soil metagenome]
MSTVTILVFGPQAAAVGGGSVRLEIALPAGIDDVLAAVVEAQPALAPQRATLRVAVNQAFAAAGQLVKEGDEVALIGLVSGG